MIFLTNIKYFNKKIELQFNNTLLVVELNNYTAKTVNVYIVSDLGYWPKIQRRNFTSKNFLFEATNIVTNNNKEKYVYSRYGIAFDGKGSWSFNDDITSNIIIFAVDISSSSHTDNPKNYFLILDERDTFGINGSFGAPKKSILILVKQIQNFALAWIIIVIIVFICKIYTNFRS